MSDAYHTPIVMCPYFSLVFANRSAYTCTVWIAFNGDWWAAPTLRSGYSLLPVPVLEGFQVDWKVISETMVDEYNARHPCSFDSQLENILEESRFVKWQGSFFCEASQLGRGIRIELC
jgi:hypothetical protein